MELIFLIWSAWGIAILRLALGAVLLARGVERAKDMEAASKHCEDLYFRPGRVWARIDASLYLILGGLLFLGVFTVYVSLIVALEALFIMLWTLRLKQENAKVAEADVLIFATAVALTTLGGGAYAIDNILRIFF